MGELEQSVAVITGAANGIGRALATRLAEEGARLCLADINDFLARTTPERAADRIVSGMLQGETRILIGRDAAQIDMIHRLFPERYWRIIKPLVDMRTRGVVLDSTNNPEAEAPGD